MSENRKTEMELTPMGHVKFFRACDDCEKRLWESSAWEIYSSLLKAKSDLPDDQAFRVTGAQCDLNMFLKLAAELITRAEWESNQKDAA